MERNMQLQDWLDDLCVRFLMNGPKEDLETAERICFRVEEAQWYYEDFIRPQDPTLPSMTLKCFCDEIFAHCPLLLPFSQDHRMKAFDAFLSYKKRVPVRGAIMLNQNMDKLVLVKGWKKGANWSFPRGKINKDEDDLDCAIREVYEETGFDLGEAGFIPADRQVKSIELNMHEQQIRLFVFRGIPMNINFEPKTRKEISAIDWWQLSDLPAFRKGKAHIQQPVYKVTNFYMVAPFLAHVRKWIAEQKKLDANRMMDGKYQPEKALWPDEATSEEEQMAESSTKIISREKEPFTTDTRSSLKEVAKLNNLMDDIRSVGLTHERTTDPPVNDAGSALLLLLNSKTEAAINQRPNYSTQNKTENVPVSDNGSALLALLNSKASIAKNQRINYLPQTPTSHKNLQSHTPITPLHDQTPNASLITTMLPSPKISVPRQDENSIHYHQQLIKNQYDSVADIKKKIQSNQYSSITSFNPHPHPHPNTYQHQHLIHPQPLPPNVQRTVFAQSPMSASPLASKALHQSSTSKMPQIPITGTTSIPGVEKNMSPKFTYNKISLLNSIKGHNHSLLSEVNIKPNSEIGMGSKSSKGFTLNYTQEANHRSNFLPLQIKKDIPSTLSGLQNDQLSQISALNGYPKPRTSTIVSDVPIRKKGSQSISHSDKQFLLSYLDAVVAKGINF
ncbi:putative mrna decapping complex subunit 2 [Erysiphe necator]|uniref:Putative mrna decapping complex subunit 2 n=1 Tax=Uncinula necator TaxID=52586 RepID=A0A0B1P202_UNCNE|nr:putative mrna decapping complex subunit 2 [Erysiphe necator]